MKSQFEKEEFHIYILRKKQVISISDDLKFILI